MMNPKQLRDKPLEPVYSEEGTLVADILGDRLELKHAITPTGIAMHPAAFLTLQRNPHIQTVTVYGEGINHYTVDAEYFINHAIKQKDGLWLPLTKWRNANQE